MDPVPFSPKQLRVLNWWLDCRTRDMDAIICDGAVRSGKTTALSLGFVIWASACFDGCSFALCGKTIGSLRRNLITQLVSQLRLLGFEVAERVSRGYFDIGFGGHSNRFYLFGGKDEASASLIQGITLAGVLLDEVALMPRSFVDQAIARCSVPGARLWFSCNPESPAHWFYREWICKTKEKHVFYLHFTMQDNASLSPSVRARYERLYSGAFYDRYVLGKWTAAHGLIYPMFSERLHTGEPPAPPERYAVSCDYGTMNPTSIGLWGLCRGCWYRIAESYYDGRMTGQPRTDEEHYEALRALVGGRSIEAVIVDPSAASFIACIRKHGEYRALPARNDVLSGIRRVADAIRGGEIRISPQCRDTLREFTLYAWDSSAQRDTPIKENDHAMDDIRYFVSTFLEGEAEQPFYVASVKRQ